MDVTAAPSYAGSNVNVQFFSRSDYPKAVIPETTFSVPATVTPEGLNALVNEILALSPAVPLDFLIDNKYVVTTLEKFMRRNNLTPEEVLRIEYKPALQAEEGSKLPHDDWVSSVRVPVAGCAAIMVTAAYDHCVRVWNDDVCLAIGAGHLEAVKEIALHVVTPAGDGAPRRRVVQGGKRKRNGADDASIPAAVEFASVGKDGTLRAWRFTPESKTIKRLGTVSQHTDTIDTVDICNGFVATGAWDCSVKVFNWSDLIQSDESPQQQSRQKLITGGCAPVFSFTDHARAVLKVRFSPQFASNKTLYSTGLDGCVKMWNTETAQLSGTLEASHAAYSLAARPGISSPHDMVVTGCTDGRLRLYDPRTKKGAVQTWSGHRQWVYGVTWMWRSDDDSASTVANHHDGILLASASEDSTVRIWDMRSTGGAALLTLDQLHANGVLDVTYAGGSEIVSCGKDNKAKSFKVGDSPN